MPRFINRWAVLVAVVALIAAVVLIGITNRRGEAEILEVRATNDDSLEVELGTCNADVSVRVDEYHDRVVIRARHHDWYRFLTGSDDCTDVVRVQLEDPLGNRTVTNSSGDEFAVTRPDATITALPPDRTEYRLDTGVESVDQVANDILAGDVEAVLGRLRFTDVPCIAVAEDIGHSPVCEAGEAPGTPVRVFPVASEVPWLRDPDEAVRDALASIVRPYAVAHGPAVDDRPGDGPQPALPDYILVFEARVPDFPGTCGLAVDIVGDEIVMIVPPRCDYGQDPSTPLRRHGWDLPLLLPPFRDPVSLSAGEPVATHLCRQHLSWTRPARAEIADLLGEAPFSGNGLSRTEAVADSLGSFFYLPQPELHDLLGVPSSGQCAASDASLWLFDHTLVELRADADRLVAVVDRAPGRWEEVLFEGTRPEIHVVDTTGAQLYEEHRAPAPWYRWEANRDGAFVYAWVGGHVPFTGAWLKLGAGDVRVVPAGFHDPAPSGGSVALLLAGSDIASHRWEAGDAWADSAATLAVPAGTYQVHLAIERPEGVGGPMLGDVLFVPPTVAMPVNLPVGETQ